MEVFLYHSRVHTISNSIFKDTYLSSSCSPPFPLIFSFLYPPSTLQFTSHPLWLSIILPYISYPCTSFLIPSCCGTINIFLHCKPNSYTLFDGVFFLMACPLLDHILAPWGASSRKQGECLFGVILLVSRVHEDGLKSIPVLSTGEWVCIPQK